tara:strand:- start:22225 stop:23517 length:1293 start_codon:yes stop_codon:yes gene_type:complete
MYEYAPQANQLANQGRYGDSMMVHMNPLEVAVMNQMSGNQMTVNPTTGQPEAFAFLLPLLGSIGGTALGASGALGLGGGLLASGVGGALGSALGQTAATGSLKEGLKAGLISGATAGLAGALGGAAGSAAGSGAAGQAGKTGILSAINPQGAVDAGKAFQTFGPAQAGTKLTSFGDVLKASAVPGAFSGAVGASQYVPEFKDDDPNFLGGKPKDIPEALPPSRRINPMAPMQPGAGEKLFFSDPNPNPQSGNRPQFADTARKYGSVGRMQEGGLASIDPNAMPAPMPPPMPNEMMGEPLVDELEQSQMMQSEGGREDMARVFNDAVAALMGQHPAPKEVIRRFLEIFGEERLMSLVDQVRKKVEMPQEGRMVMGQGPDGMDNIPASVEGQQPVLLANNEYVLPEKVTSAVGNGSPEMGAEVLDEMVAQVP